MSEDNYSGDLHAWIEPELEARLVALVLGEASDFEQDELARLMEERPELAAFKRRLETMDEVLRESVKPSDDAKWKLPPATREKVLEAIGQPGAAPGAASQAEPAGKKVVHWRRSLLSLAACLLLLVGMGALLTPAVVKSLGRAPEVIAAEKREERDRLARADYYMEAESEMDPFGSAHDLSIFPETPATPSTGLVRDDALAAIELIREMAPSADSKPYGFALPAEPSSAVAEMRDNIQAGNQVALNEPGGGGDDPFSSYDVSPSRFERGLTRLGAQLEPESNEALAENFGEGLARQDQRSSGRRGRPAVENRLREEQLAAADGIHLGEKIVAKKPADITLSRGAEVSAGVRFQEAAQNEELDALGMEYGITQDRQPWGARLKTKSGAVEQAKSNELSFAWVDDNNGAGAQLGRGQATKAARGLSRGGNPPSVLPAVTANGVAGSNVDFFVGGSEIAGGSGRTAGDPINPVTGPAVPRQSVALGDGDNFGRGWGAAGGFGNELNESVASGGARESEVFFDSNAELDGDGFAKESPEGSPAVAGKTLASNVPAPTTVPVPFGIVEERRYARDLSGPVVARKPAPASGPVEVPALAEVPRSSMALFKKVHGNQVAPVRDLARAQSESTESAVARHEGKGWFFEDKGREAVTRDRLDLGVVPEGEEGARSSGQLHGGNAESSRPANESKALNYLQRPGAAQPDLSLVEGTRSRVLAESDEELEREQFGRGSLFGALENQLEGVGAKIAAGREAREALRSPHNDALAKALSADPPEEPDLALVNKERELYEAEREKQQLEIQLKTLAKLGEDERFKYAAGLNLPNNPVPNLYEEYLEGAREVEALKAGGLGEGHPKVAGRAVRLKDLRRKMKRAVGSGGEQSDGLAGGEGEDLMTRSFDLSPELVEELRQVAVADDKADALDVVTWSTWWDDASVRVLLENQGISFPGEAVVSYSRAGNKLVIRNTPGNLDLTEALVAQLSHKVRAKKRTEKERELSAKDEPFSTFSLHVSDVSFKLAQAALKKGQWPEAERIRSEEFVNALAYGDPTPTQREKVACQVEQAVHPFVQQRNLVRVSMRTAAEGRGAATPLRLTILLDNSGSMERADRTESVTRAFDLLAAQLQPQDEVTLISFARTPRLVRDRLSGEKAQELSQLVSQIPSEGGTNLEAALALGVEKAKAGYLEGAQNRVILLTDGAANLGNARPEELQVMVEKMREQGIAFDACGVGADGLNDEILESLTRKGDGRYYFLDRPEDADEGFARQIAGALRPAAKNVKVQVEFNPDRVGRYKLHGFEKHELKKEDFRNDSVDAAELAAEEAGVAMYQVETLADGSGPVGTVSVRFQDTASGQMIERTWDIPFEGQPARLSEADARLRLAATASLLGERLKGSAVGESVGLAQLAALAHDLPSLYPNQARVRHLVEMVEAARTLAGE